MKILLIHPGFDWASGDISLSAERALRELGCKVIPFSPLDGLRAFNPLLSGAAKKGIKTTADMALRLFCERIPLRAIEEKPDLMLAVHGGRLPVHVVDAVRKLGVRTAVWLLDDPHELDLSSRYARHYEWVFTDERMAVSAHKAAGSVRTFHLPLGCDPELHRPRQVSERYRSDVCILGTGFSERLKLLESVGKGLCEFDVKLVGHWEGIPGDSPLKGRVVDGFVRPEEAAKYYAGARIVLNQHRDGAGLSLSSNLWNVRAVSPNPRLFEASACGAFVLTDDKRVDVGRYFRIGEEADIYHDEAGLLSKVRYWLDRERERAAGAAAASARSRRDYSLSRRMAELLEISCGWHPAQAGTAAGAGTRS